MRIERREECEATWIEVASESGLELTLCSVGASVYSVKLDGVRLSLVLKNLEDFENTDQFFGKTLARVAGRLPVEYSFQGETIRLPENEPGDCLHGGKLNSLSFKNYDVEVKEESGRCEVRFTYHSPDGENGFPGNVTSTVTYVVDDEKTSFIIGFEATSDRLTPFSYSNHIYWDLCDDNDISNQTLYVNSDRVGRSEGTSQLILGEIPAPECLNFTTPRLLGPALDQVETTLTAGTIDHTFLYRNVTEDEPQATLENDKVKVECYTDMEAMNIYVDNSKTDVEFENGEGMARKRRAIALEPQMFILNQGALTLSLEKPLSHWIRYEIVRK